MKTFACIALSGLALTMVGCTTSKQVQEMIDSSYRDHTDAVDSHEASIDVLKQSAMTGLEKSKENGDQLVQIEAQLVEMNEKIKLNKGYAEASKVMSAANTVKAAELDELLKANIEADRENKERLMEIDKLYAEVMIAHYQMIADSANQAMESLKSQGWDANTNAPVEIDEPIEIVAPSTEAAVSSTNALPVQ